MQLVLSRFTQIINVTYYNICWLCLSINKKIHLTSIKAPDMLLHNLRSMSLYNQRSILKVSGTVMNEWEVSEKNKIKLFIRKFVTFFFKFCLLNSFRNWKLYLVILENTNWEPRIRKHDLDSPTSEHIILNTEIYSEVVQ